MITDLITSKLSVAKVSILEELEGKNEDCPIVSRLLDARCFIDILLRPGNGKNTLKRDTFVTLVVIQRVE